MKIRPIEDRRRREYLMRLLGGKPFEEACRLYVLKTRSPQYLAVQPLERDEYVDGRHEHYFQRAVKHFPADDPAGKHCCSREELISEAARTTGLPEEEAAVLLDRLFAFQPELTFCERGALCKMSSVPGFACSGAARAAIPYGVLARELPEEWYISLQIPEPVIEKMVWGCRKTGSPEGYPCSRRFAERLLRLYKRRRGEFIREYSFETLKFFWLEYGSMKFPRRDVERVVGRILAAA
ncbi:MAG: hypothetical protein IJS01_14100 [Lentisphaeria bacterium]|nr:hypothetical protein [Lentisphaeria bacterium]